MITLSEAGPTMRAPSRGIFIITTITIIIINESIITIIIINYDYSNNHNY